MAGLADPPVGHPIRSPVQADPAASGARRCTASSFVLPHVTAATWRPSSRLDRNVRNPSGDGSKAMIAWGLTGVDEMGLRARQTPSPPRWGRLRSGGCRPEIGESDFSERRPERDATRRLYQHLGFSQVLEISREGVGFGDGTAPSPEKSTTWRYRAKTVIFLPLPQGERNKTLTPPPATRQSLSRIAAGHPRSRRNRPCRHKRCAWSF